MCWTTRVQVSFTEEESTVLRKAADLLLTHTDIGDKVKSHRKAWGDIPLRKLEPPEGKAENCGWINVPFLVQEGSGKPLPAQTVIRNIVVNNWDLFEEALRNAGWKLVDIG